MSNKTIDDNEYERLKLIEAYFLFLLDSSSDFIYFKDPQFRFTYTSKLFANLTGHKNWKDLAGKTDFEVFDLEHASLYREMDKKILNGNTINSHKESYYDNKQQLCWVSTSKAPLPLLNGKKLGMFGISRDITETIKLEKRLSDLARTDNLTKLENRNSFLEQTKRFLEISKRQEQNCALFFIDLDKFKYINDTFGHDAGDEVLKQTASRLLNITRESDFVCRFGGDEFLLLTILSDYSDIGIISEKIRSAINQNIDFRDFKLEPACSIGISLYPKNAESIDKLISMADVAMYKAKREGINRIKLYEESD